MIKGERVIGPATSLIDLHTLQVGMVVEDENGALFIRAATDDDIAYALWKEHGGD